MPYLTSVLLDVLFDYSLYNPHEQSCRLRPDLFHRNFPVCTLFAMFNLVKCDFREGIYRFIL